MSTCRPPPRGELAAAGLPNRLVDYLDKAFALIRDGALEDTAVSMGPPAV